MSDEYGPTFCRECGADILPGEPSTAHAWGPVCERCEPIEETA